MSATIVNPDVPYNGEVPGKLQPGWMCRLQGVTHPEADRFNINLQVGPNSKPRDDTALHLSVRLNQGYIARNSYQGGSWGDEQGNGTLPIGVAESWEIIILVDQNDYKIAVNGQHLCEFPFRIPISKVSHLLIDGDVSITLISWEGIAGVGTESSTQSSQLHSQTPQGFQGAPPQANFNPQGGYGAPGYGPPPPPGVEPHSGFENFFEQAQTVLAGAIKSGAAEKLLGGLLSSGGQQQQQGPPQGYAHQNAKYGIYPDLPQDLDPNYQESRGKQSQQPGPVESLLMNFLSGGNKQQNQLPPDTQQSQPPQQGIDLNSLLGNLLAGNQKPSTQQQYQTQQNTPGNQEQSLDLSSLLSGLLSSTGQTQQHPQGQVSQGQVPQTHIQESNRQQHGQDPNSNQGIDLTQIMGALSGLMAHTRPVQETGSTGGVHTPQSVQVPQGEQGKGVDLSGILSGLLSGGNKQNPEQLPPGQAPPGQIPPRQGAGADLNSLLSGLLSGGGSQQQNPPQGPGQYPPNNPQSQGIDFNSLLSNLLAGDSNHGQPHSGQPRPEFPHGPSSPQPPQIAKFGPGNPQFAPNAPQAPPEHLPRQIPGGNQGKGSQPASNTEIEDVSDQLAEVIASEGGTGSRNQASQQYGQYPHPPQQERGPVEGLLSSFLGGGAQQTHQPQSNFGGGESIGGLGSMSGILSGLAGSLLQPRDNQNQRQNY